MTGPTAPSPPCTSCGKRPRLGMLSRCKPCLQSDSARDRAKREPSKRNLGQGPAERLRTEAAA